MADRPVLNGVSATPVADLTASQVAHALARSFEGYLGGTFQVDARAYERRFRGEDLDPFASHVYHRDGSPVGVSLVARRGWTSRVAGMAVVPEMRSRGLGRSIMEGVVREAASRGDQRLILEVFEQNEPALGLYERLGFRAKRRLIGYQRADEPGATRNAGSLSECDPLDVARVVAREGAPDLPWMLAAETLAATTYPERAFHLGLRAYALIKDTEKQNLVLRALFVPRGSRHEGWGTRLLGALDATFPGRSWSVPEIVPEGLADSFFRKAGWERSLMNQLEMHLELPARDRSDEIG